MSTVESFVTNPFGLPPFTHQTILTALARYPEIVRAVVFGSRATGAYRPGSDVDLCLFGNEVTLELAHTVSIQLNEELPIPYFFDVLAFDYLENDELRTSIEREGRLLYRASGSHRRDELPAAQGGASQPHQS